MRGASEIPQINTRKSFIQWLGCVSPFFRAALVALSRRENSKWTRQVAVVGAKKNLKIVGIFSFPHTHILYCKVLSNSGNKCAYS